MLKSTYKNILLDSLFFAKFEKLLFRYFMKNKILLVLVVCGAAYGISTLSFKSSDYKPRTSSKIDEVLTFQRAGGKIAAGMSDYFGALRNNPATGMVSPEEYMAAIEASMKMQTKRAVNSVWNELGPDNVGGRTRAFLIDKDSTNIMYVGSVSGGLFKSTTRGLSWTPINDYQENLNVSCIAQAATGEICYGTGEGEFVSITGTSLGTPGFAGAGIFRSTNRGRSFTRLAATANFGNINSMAADMRSGKSIIYASTSGGIRKSIDGGATWTMAKTGNSKEVKVGVDGMVIAQSASTIVKSTDEGTTWTTITPPSVGISRASIAISPQDPSYVYIMVSGNDSKLVGVYRTKDAGSSWEQIVAASTTYFDPLISLASSQGYYNNVLTVDPLDKNHIIMGGVALAEWREGNNPKYIASQNDFGGANPAYVHSDKHVLQWDMSTTPPTLICGNDGGLFFSSDNAKTFTAKNQGFNATQFYAVAADYMGNVVGGTQDNGTQYINKKGNTKKAAVEIKGGDGFQSEISVKDNSIIFSETYYANVTRSRDFGKTQSCLWDRRIARTFLSLSDTAKYCEHNHSSNYAPFNAKFRLWEHPDPNNNTSRLFLAINGSVWMGIGVTDFQKEPEWYMLTSAIGGGQVWDLEPSNDGNSLFITNSNSIYRIDGINSATYYKWSNYNAIPPGISFKDLGFTANGARAISSICLDPNDNNTALITLGQYGSSNYVYKGTNMLGTTASFTNITNNLPAMPVYDGLIALSSSNLMFLATDLGVYASDDGGATWSAQTNATNKFPKVATLSIRQYTFPGRNRGSIYAGTHGRGFFECQQYYTNINDVQNTKSSNALKLYPNPSDDVVNVSIDIKGNVEDVTVKVLDFTGKTVMTKIIVKMTSATNEVALDTKALQAGTYIVTAVGNGGYNFGVLKLVIRH
jgi:photosystem II stability/assembly factor-like uncharacterized protein